MTPYWLTYLFVIGFVIVMEFAIARAYKKRFNLRGALILSAAACVGLTLFYAILAI